MDIYDEFFKSLSLDPEGLSRQFMDFSAFLNIIAAAVMGFLVLGVYLSSSGREKRDRNLYLVIPVLSVLMAVMMRVSGPQALAFFGIFGILSMIRFRSNITDQKGITFILFAVIEGLIVGINSYLLALLAWVVVGGAILIGRYFMSHRVAYRIILDYGILPPPECRHEVAAWFASRGIPTSSTLFGAVNKRSNKTQAWTIKAKAEFLAFPRHEDKLLALLPIFIEEMNAKGVQVAFRRRDQG